MEHIQNISGLNSGDEGKQQEQNQQQEVPITEVDKTIYYPEVKDDETIVPIEQPAQIKQHDYVTPQVVASEKNESESRGQNENMNNGKSNNQTDNSNSSI